MAKYTAVIIGGGQIGADPSPMPSFAKALMEHTSCDLVGIVEPNHKRRSAVGEYFQVQTFESIHTLNLSQIDLIVIASPDATHGHYLDAVVAFNPKWVICEKPLNLSKADGVRLGALYASKQISLVAHYTRRFIPVYEELRERILREQHLSTVIYYGKGLLHNGVHALDLIHWYYGKPTEYTVLASRVDAFENDPTVSVRLKTKTQDNIVLQALDQSAYTHFEVDIFTRSGRYRIYDDHRTLHIDAVKDGVGIPLGLRLQTQGCFAIAHETSFECLLGALFDNKLSGQTLFYQALEVEALATTIQLENKRLQNEYQSTLCTV